MPATSRKVIPFEIDGDVEAPPDAAHIDQTIRRAQRLLLDLQEPGGCWRGELIVDSTLCADTIIYLRWLGRGKDPLVARCADHIRSRQLPDGGWNIYAGGPGEINASVKGYLALKLAGDLPGAAWMREARANILRLGGIPNMNTYGKLYLALLGQFPWEHVPTIPVELFLLPDWAPFNIYDVSSWSRAILAPLAILNHFKPTRPLPEHLAVHELYPAGMEGSDLSLRKDPRFWAWSNFFLRCDRLFKIYERFHPSWLRRRALAFAEAWMVERMGEGSEGLGAIFPSMLNSMMALRVLGYAEDHPLVRKAESDFGGLFVEEDGEFRIQPCLSPVWDTAITAIALVESGVSGDHPALQKAGLWLEGEEVRTRGDWAVRNPGPEPSGWAFERANRFYPDTDDTMMVLMALRLIPAEDADRRGALCDRALRWLMSFQCRDGGWAAFDKDVTQHWLEDVPFADHNAILDPTCSDLTARVLELLGRIGTRRSDPAVRRAIIHLRSTQEADGSWYGRWGVNYLYGTWQVLRGLASIGESMDQDWIRRGRDWLESCQNDDGGWGETPASYDDPSLKGIGPSMPSQTAWAVMGLCACGDPARPSIRRGIEWFIREQNDDGSWTEDGTTGTGFPGVFYLKYDLYRNNWPLLALATYRQMGGN